MTILCICITVAACGLPCLLAYGQSRAVQQYAARLDRQLEPKTTTSR